VWRASTQLANGYSFLGIQDATRKRRTPTTQPGPWAGMIVRTDGSVKKSVSQDRWDKTKGVLGQLREGWEAWHHGGKGHPGVKRSDLEKVAGFLVYVSRAYTSIRPYLKGLHLTLRRHGGWRVERDDAEGLTFVPDSDEPPPEFVRPVSRFEHDLRALESLTECAAHPELPIHPSGKAMAYYSFGDASGAGFGVSVWDPETGVDAAHGFEAALRLRKLEMEHGLFIHLVWVSGKRMIAQGTDGLSRGDLTTGVMKGDHMLDYVPLHLLVVDRSNKQVEWLLLACLPLGPGEKWTRLTESEWFDAPFWDGGAFLWTPPPCAADVAVSLAAKAHHVRPWNTHVVLVPSIMAYKWRRLLGKAGQCEICHFRNIEGSDPRTGHEGHCFLLLCMRRANIDTFWARKSSTVRSNVYEVRRHTRSCTRFSVGHPVGARFARGPCALDDEWGMLLACGLLERTLDSGRNSITVQYSTARRLQAAMTNYAFTTEEGGGPVMVLSDRYKQRFSGGPTSTLFYERFSLVCHARMGDVIQRDQALTIKALEALLAMAELDASSDTTSLKEQYEMILHGLALTIGYSTGLRGEELALCKLRPTISETSMSMKVSGKPFLTLVLEGSFKGVRGRKQHRFTLAPTSSSGSFAIAPGCGGRWLSA
jgi:hypothetical protein